MSCLVVPATRGNQKPQKAFWQPPVNGDHHLRGLRVRGSEGPAEAFHGSPFARGGPGRASAEPQTLPETTMLLILCCYTSQRMAGVGKTRRTPGQDSPGQPLPGEALSPSPCCNPHWPEAPSPSACPTAATGPEAGSGLARTGASVPAPEASPRVTSMVPCPRSTHGPRRSMQMHTERRVVIESQPG